MLVLIPGALLLPSLATSRPGAAIALCIPLLGLMVTGGVALRKALIAPATPAQVEGLDDLTPKQLAFGWGSLLLAAVPLFWLILGIRAIAVFSSQLSLGFVQ
ncbi:hypothetical protein D3C72_1403930 [compost metagenome]